MGRKLNIIIADDSRVFFEGIKFLVDSWADSEIIAGYVNGLELVNSPILASADVLLIDIEMPVMNGLEAARQVNIKYPEIPMIALTMYQEKAYLKDIIFAGFKAFIYKPDVPVKLLKVIKQVIHNEYIFPIDLKF